MTSVRLTLPFPPKLLSPNGRPKHWGALHEAKKRYRHACKVLATDVRNLSSFSYPLKSPVQARVIFVVPRGLLPDEDNCTASFKAGWDGIVDSKLLVDDSPEHLHVVETLVQRGPKREVRVLLEDAS